MGVSSGEESEYQKKVGQWKDMLTSWPTPEEFEKNPGLWEGVAFWNAELFPIPLPPEPNLRLKDTRSHRICARRHRRKELWIATCCFIDSLNGLYFGRCASMTIGWDARFAFTPGVEASWLAVHRMAFEECKRLSRARRVVPTGALAFEQLLKRPDFGYVDSRQSVRESKQVSSRMVELVGSLMDEPTSNKCIKILDALDVTESNYYGSEANVMKPGERCPASPWVPTSSYANLP